uniref:hypothetical protein n=1 Tax=Salmonella enterica TaxID=28901 RepID=UPI00398C36A9
ASGDAGKRHGATAEVGWVLTGGGVMKAGYGNGGEACAADGGVNGGAYPKMVEPDLGIRE